MSEKSRYCEKCHKTMGEEQFYKSNNKTKYPDGKVNICKKCMTMHVDNWDYDTYSWILEELDVPYVPKEWNSLLRSYGQDRSKITGLTIVGRYLSKMKLKQYKDYRWKDSEFLQELEKHEISESMKRQGYSAQEIAEALATGITEAPPPPPSLEEGPGNEPPQRAYYIDNEISQSVENSMIADLTEDDKLYLCMKWGKAYRPEEWVRLEQLYDQMMNSYDIQAAGDKNTLILACKSSLKANELMDLGDIEGAQKASKMYDQFMKAGKWTAQQNKTEESELIDSIGELVTLCEMDGFIPKYYVDTPQDKVDRVLQDLQHYTENLVSNETNLEIMVDRAQTQIKEEEARIAAAAEAGTEADEEIMFNYDKPVFDLEDYSEFKDFQNEQEETTDEYLMSLMEGEE